MTISKVVWISTLLLATLLSVLGLLPGCQCDVTGTQQQHLSAPQR